jgi:hypothetical protein
VKIFTEDAPINSDYFPVVEFDSGRQKNRYNPAFHWYQLKLLYDNTERVNFTELLSFDGMDELRMREVLSELLLSQRANTYLFNAMFSPTFQQKVRQLEQGLAIDPDNPDLLNWRVKLRPVKSPKR